MNICVPREQNFDMPYFRHNFIKTHFKENSILKIIQISSNHDYNRARVPSGRVGGLRPINGNARPFLVGTNLRGPMAHEVDYSISQMSTYSEAMLISGASKQISSPRGILSF